ncbi:asparaginase domain-containing protein [Pseudoclavibacter sp. CFCC 13611]|uniref:asparaginase domain-containing protein n=1 Tax=Pseudoclavibacter sp. CFCC 13611 TaxID=2615178 RepID=UPI001CE441AC|nr:asparaginase domain-containing protein [Pseudoclavibacter sp. CFCC 13611]
MRLTLVHTGGTIGMSESAAGLVPDPDFVGRLLAEGALPEGTDVVELAPLLDSANVGPVEWQLIVDAVVAAIERGADAVVVLHGTDTLAFTAAALSLAVPIVLREVDRPARVVLTGAQHPLYGADGTHDADAEANLRDALAAAQALAAAPTQALAAAPPQTSAARSAQAPEVGTAGAVGVFVQFGGRLLPGLHVSKISSVSAQGFVATNGRRDSFAAAGAVDGASGGRLEFGAFAPHEIGVAMVYPGVTAAQLDAALGNGPAAVLCCFGSGAVPSGTPGVEDVLRQHARRQTVVAISQSGHGGVHLGAYAAAAPLQTAGVVDGRDLTLEAALAALHVALACGLCGAGAADFVAAVAGQSAS